MVACMSCTAEIPDTFLCSTCRVDLRDSLLSLVTGGTITDAEGKERELTGLLEELSLTAIGQSRLNDPVRRSRREPPSLGQQLGQPLTNGEAHPIALFPSDDETDLEKAREQRPLLLRRRLLAQGRVNEPASDLEAEIHRSLKLWVDGRGGLAAKHARALLPPPNWHRPAHEYRHTTRDYALWLAQATHLIALDEDAGAFHKTIRQYIARINRVIDRKAPPQFAGLCITVITEDHSKCVDAAGKPSCSGLDHLCAVSLWAKRGSVEVVCPSCRTTHRIDELVDAWLNAEEDKWYTVKELLDVIFPRLPVEERVPKSTIYDWRSRGLLTGMTKHRDDGELMIKLSALRRLRAEQLEKAVG